MKYQKIFRVRVTDKQNGHIIVDNKYANEDYALLKARKYSDNDSSRTTHICVSEEINNG